ncbi:hypothetical protein FZEAL_9312 [Fusarium zealandicum]|uniref:Uncharacterized protein n=1 Tax=Fusarium zealandicum TaxID=1053134 RepID=A0A8H4XGE8_9HYPO|nr:hypothetical protein FZEAL_9312 [Fusarium zealandicum]
MCSSRASITCVLCHPTLTRCMLDRRRLKEPTPAASMWPRNTQVMNRHKLYRWMRRVLLDEAGKLAMTASQVFPVDLTQLTEGHRHSQTLSPHHEPVVLHDSQPQSEQYTKYVHHDWLAARDLTDAGIIWVLVLESRNPELLGLIWGIINLASVQLAPS